MVSWQQQEENKVLKLAADSSLKSGRKVVH